jgi:glycosyltransferase involved in cell wall biosynthesis
MKILFIHTRGYHSSGPETYLDNMAQMLEVENIEYDLFCLDYSGNNFGYVLPEMPKPIGAADVYRYSDQKLSMRDKVRVLLGSFFRLDVFSRLNKVLSRKKYDQIIVLQYFLKLSPAVFLAAKKNSVKVTFRQSDFGLICARNTFYRDRAVCTLCTKNQLNMVANRCGGGLISSALLYIIYKVNHLVIRYANPTIVWTNRNSFNIGSKAKVLRGLEHTLNYTPVGIIASDKVPADKIYDYGCIGRLSVDKGVDFLLEQLLRKPKLEFNFIFVGGVDEKLIELVELVKAKHPEQTVFIDKVPKISVAGYMDSCRYLVFMSSWFDNLPNSLIEAYSRGIPCILPDFGCFSEFIPSQFPRLGYLKGSDLPFGEFSDIGYDEYRHMSESVKFISDTKFSNDQHLRVIFNETKIS